MTSIPPGRYVCVQTHGFVPWCIQRACRSQVDHTFITLPDGYIVEAEPGGVRISLLLKYEGALAVANLDEAMTDRQAETVCRKAESLVHEPYNWLALFDDGFGDLGWHWKWLLHLASADHRLDCSQLAAVCGQAAGLDWSCGKPASCAVTPADLARRPGVRRVTIG